MNPLNYASLEASKRLVEAGIVLGTSDCLWGYHKPPRDFPPEYGWELVTRKFAKSVGGHYSEKIPAPSMAEVWRELPIGTMMEKGLDYFLCWKFKAITVKNINPTDALIDLLIWVRKEADYD